jgi:uncharacterized RDD family membrane protein YckC
VASSDGADPFAFTDLPEDDSPELAEPPATSDADQAFAELTARVRADHGPPPAAAGPPVRSVAPPPLPPTSPPAPPLASVPARPRRAPTPRPRAPTPPQPRRVATPASGLPEGEVAPVEIHVRRAAPWRRAAAWMVDAVPFAVACAVLLTWVARQGVARAAGAGGLEPLIDLVVGEQVIAGSVAGAVLLALFSYATLAHALGGATLGKWLVHIRVVGPDGDRPSLTRSAVRSALAGLSLALLGLGFLLALFTRTGRALHDLVARTWVVEAP